MTTPPVIISGQLATTAPTTIYAVPPNTTTITVTAASLYNSAASATVVTVAVAPYGAPVDATRTVMSYNLAAGDSTIISEIIGATWSSGTVLSLTASQAGVVNYTITVTAS